MDYKDYAARFRAHQGLVDLTTFASVHEGDDDYPLLVARASGRRTLLITAGFHGDETAGPLTLLEHLPEIVDHARARDVGLVIYPCLNPSGFTDGTRYNRSGEAPNNDLLRYETAPGEWVGELPRGAHFLQHRLHVGGPKETRALAAELARMPTPAAALDLHQDPWLGGTITYAYTFGPARAYLPFVEASARHLEVARSQQVDDDVHTDENGLIELTDGSVTDYMFRRGVPYAAALETTTTSAMPACHRVNLIWLRGFIDLAAEARPS